MNQKYTITVGSASFRDLVSTDGLTVAANKLFVDKTLFIKEFLDNGAKVLLITRPRRWGKSSALSLLQHFFCKEVGRKPTVGLFKKLKIEQYLSDPYYQKHQGAHPVILISFKDLKGETYEDVEAKIRGKIAELYKKHEYILQALEDRSPNLCKANIVYETSVDKFRQILREQSSIRDLETSLKILSEWLTLYHGQKTIILIDEYDNAINDNFNNPQVLEKLTTFFSNLLGSCLKDNDDYLEKGLITGILRIAKANIFSGLNNLVEETILDYQFNDYYGFTEAEVNELLDKTDFANKKEEIKAWYNGYIFGNHTLYNPWSIMQCIYRKGELEPYWVDTASPQMIEDLLINKSSVENKLQVSALIKKGEASLEQSIKKSVSFDDLASRPEMLWSLLLHTGYLTLSENKNKHKLRFPNKEVALLIKDYVDNWFIAHPVLTKTANSLLAGDFPAFESAFRKILSNEAYSARIFSGGGRAANEPIIEQAKEFMYQFLIMKELHCVNLSGKPEYEVFAEPEGVSIGKTRPDVLILNHKHKLCIVIEVKVASYKNNDLEKLAEVEALGQIKKNQYGKMYQEQHGYQILPLGAAFKGNDFVLAY